MNRTVCHPWQRPLSNTVSPHAIAANRYSVRFYENTPETAKPQYINPTDTYLRVENYSTGKARLRRSSGILGAVRVFSCSPAISKECWADRFSDNSCRGGLSGSKAGASVAGVDSCIRTHWNLPRAGYRLAPGRAACSEDHADDGPFFPCGKRRFGRLGRSCPRVIQNGLTDVPFVQGSPKRQTAPVCETRP